MKKFFMIICCLFLVIAPLAVSAKEKEKINVYIFYGDGCPHCHRAFEFFDSIEEEYGEYYKLLKYETWYSHANKKMMLKVAEALGTNTENLGVPYIIIGDKTFLGYSEAYNDDIKEAIKNAYENDSYEDKVKPIVDDRAKERKKTLCMAGGACTILIALTIINVISRKKLIKG